MLAAQEHWMLEPCTFSESRHWRLVWAESNQYRLATIRVTLL